MEGNIAARAFVVETQDGLVVDVHLGRQGAARATSTGSPATIVVDLLGGGSQPPGRPAIGASAVVLAPLGPMATYPIEVVGYARSRSGAVEILVTGAGGSAEPVTAEAGTYPWRAFTAVVPSGPEGAIRHSAGDAVVLLAVP